MRCVLTNLLPYLILFGLLLQINRLNKERESCTKYDFFPYAICYYSKMDFEWEGEKRQPYSAPTDRHLDEPQSLSADPEAANVPARYRTAAYLGSFCRAPWNEPV